MADRYDPLPDLAELLRASLEWRRDAPANALRIADRLGITGDDCSGNVEVRLRKALGLPAAGTCELVGLAGCAPCTEPAVARVTRSCACDPAHVTERRVCDGHRQPVGPLWCRACYRLPAGAHKCPVALFPAGAVVSAAAPEAGGGEAARTARAGD